MLTENTTCMTAFCLYGIAHWESLVDGSATAGSHYAIVVFIVIATHSVPMVYPVSQAEFPFGCAPLEGLACNPSTGNFDRRVIWVMTVNSAIQA
jgi:hypothetical protein